MGACQSQNSGQNRRWTICASKQHSATAPPTHAELGGSGSGPFERCVAPGRSCCLGPISGASGGPGQRPTRLQAGAPHARIAVANVPDIALLPHFRSSNQQDLRERISAYNLIISNIVAHHHVILIDLYQSWQELSSHPEYISSDGFHPNAIGYTRVAEIFYQVLHRNGL